MAGRSFGGRSLISCSFGRSFGQSVVLLVGRLFDRSEVGRSVDRLVNRARSVN